MNLSQTTELLHGKLLGAARGIDAGGAGVKLERL
jgi:hypothetical protein